MICKDCEHYFLCANDITNTYEDCKNKNDVEKRCLYFKDKSTTLDLPCKVGDTVYQTDTVGERIYPSKIKNIIFDTDGGFAFDQNAIGKSVFLTREEAEQRLEE